MNTSKFNNLMKSAKHKRTGLIISFKQILGVKGKFKTIKR